VKQVIIIFGLFFFAQVLSGQPNIIFSDGFETGELDPDFWTARPNLDGANGIIEVTTASGVAVGGQFGVRIGKALDERGQFTLNALDLTLNLTGFNQVFLDFWIQDYRDETHVQDGIYFSDDGGASFTKVWDFDPEQWCSGYGQHPPLNLSQLANSNGLGLTEKFVIRFQQYDDADFRTNTAQTNDMDGFALDDIRVYDPQISYATLPFSDDFESGALVNAWTWGMADETVLPLTGLIKPTARFELAYELGREGSFGALLGKRCDEAGNFNATALDLHLNLSSQKKVFLDFWIQDYRDETNIQDGLYFSDDGGASFTKVWDFDPGQWCSGYGQHPPLDVGQLATSSGLGLTEKFVIRFQQFDDADFRTNTAQTNDMDGFALDDIRVYDPQISYATLPFSDDFESGALGNAWTWGMADITTLPLTGLVKPTARFELAYELGREGSFGALLGKRCDEAGNFNATALDLHLDLANQEKVFLDFWIQDYRDETHVQDGIYFSDDGGASFTKVWDFDPGQWCSGYGQHPPLDIGQLATSNGLGLTEKFVIRFQQYDDADFRTNTAQTNDMDGFALDDIRVYDPQISYATLPFSDDFESGALGNAWTWGMADITTLPLTGLVKPTARFEVANQVGLEGSFGVMLGKRCDEPGNFVANALDLHLNLISEPFDSVRLVFSFLDRRDENHDQDGIFLSVDGGRTFQKIYSFQFEDWPNNSFSRLELNLTGLAGEANMELSDRTVIRFQQYDDSDFGTNLAQTNDMDGLILDEVSVTGQLSTSIANVENIPKIKLFPNPTSESVTISLPETFDLQNTQYQLMDLQGKVLWGGVIQHDFFLVNLSELPEGIYVLRLKTDEGIFQHRIVKVADR